MNSEVKTYNINVMAGRVVDELLHWFRDNQKQEATDWLLKYKSETIQHLVRKFDIMHTHNMRFKNEIDADTSTADTRLQTYLRRWLSIHINLSDHKTFLQIPRAFILGLPVS